MPPAAATATPAAMAVAPGGSCPVTLSWWCHHPTASCAHRTHPTAGTQPAVPQTWPRRRHPPPGAPAAPAAPARPCLRRRGRTSPSRPWPPAAAHLGALSPRDQRLANVAHVEHAGRLHVIPVLLAEGVHTAGGTHLEVSYMHLGAGRAVAGPGAHARPEMALHPLLTSSSCHPSCPWTSLQHQQRPISTRALPPHAGIMHETPALTLILAHRHGCARSAERGLHWRDSGTSGQAGCRWGLLPCYLALPHPARLLLARDCTLIS